MSYLLKIRSKPERKKKKSRDYKSNSMQKYRAFHTRRRMRGSELGMKTEARVEKLLAKKLSGGELISFEHFARYSPEDSQGKDFRVTKLINGEQVTAFFGVTISPRCAEEHGAKHYEVPIIIIPPEMGDERIWYRICQILKETNKARAS